MPRFKCIKKCYAYGKKWEIGEVLDSEFQLNHHFAVVPDNTEAEIIKRSEQPVPAQLKSAKKDPMKAVAGNSEATSFSQMQGNGSPIKTGMAAGLKNDAPVRSVQELTPV